MEHQPVQFKQRTHRRISNPMDKICSKLDISLKDMKDGGTLSKSVKLKIQKLIEKDQIKELKAFLDKKAIFYDAQIGIKSMKWNILHFAAKNNSQKILKVILIRTYQENTQKYKQLINSQTTEGYTPLMVSIINSSQQALSLLLEMGGSDTQLKDRKKMTAYDLALNYKNEQAIRELISYESLYRKRGNYPNDEILLKPIDPEIYSEPNCCNKMFDCFVDFFLCFKNDQIEEVVVDVGSDIEGQAVPSNFNNKLLSLLKSNQQAQIDMVAIGNKEIENKYAIEWKRLTTAVNQKTVLFDCFQPFDICENNLIIANSLITFQCLSDHTWLVRKIVRPVKKGESSALNNSGNTNRTNNAQAPNQYTIEMYLNDELKKITVDEHIPFLKQRQQPMFLSNSNEMWPQILQKGLAKFYGSYMKLSEINPMILIENLTGSFTKFFTLQEGISFLKNDQGQLLKQRGLMSALQDFSTKGYVILLEGRQDTTLCPKNRPASFKNYCYTILNFYEKGKKRLILVNCPYVLNSWKEKEKSQAMQLKLIKSHYNSHNQMCVWIEQSQFAHFFKRIIVSFTQPNMIRTQMKIRYLLETEFEVEQQGQPSKFRAVLQTFTNSAKNIFSSSKSIKEGQKRDSLTSNKSSVRNQSQSSCFSIVMRGLKYKLMNKVVYVKFNIENSKNTESFSLAIKDNISHSTCRIKSFKGWIDGGLKDITLEEASPFCSDLVKIKQKKGEYLCMFEVQFLYLPSICENSTAKGSNKTSNFKPTAQKDTLNTQRPLFKSQSEDGQKRESDLLKTIKKHQLLVICWSEDNVHLEHIEQEFAVIDCMQSWRKNTIKNWPFIDKRDNGPEGDSSLKYLVQRFGQKMILLTKCSKQIQLSFNIHGDKSVRESMKQFAQQSQITQIKESIISEQVSQTEYRLQMGLVSDNEHSEFKYGILWRKDGISNQLDSTVFNLNIKR